ncbi:hypothetical protein B0J17DRAFT_626193 [Rhizoctonia solani]|nr:hypothetical protein B0J17DRAFT_626193 [Rhizoctonia solani]
MSLTQLCNKAKYSAEKAHQFWQHMFALKHQMEQDFEKLISQATEIQVQHNLVSNLKECHIVMHHKHNALHKQFVCQNKKLVDIKQNLEHGNDSICHYRLKEDAGVIQSEVWVMIRKLAVQGVSTKHVTEIMKIVGETLGVEIIGSISAHSVAQIMLEGLVQSQMQIAQELNQADLIEITN